MRVLLVEDDNGIALEIKRALERASYQVEWRASGKGALAANDQFFPDLLILDLGLPDLDGLALLRRLRRDGNEFPILVLTARGKIDIKVEALDAGADDYLTKPFEIPELLARIRVLARRLGTLASSELVSGDVTLNLASQLVFVSGERVSLSRREYLIFSALMENAGRILTKEVLSQKLYGWNQEVSSNTIEVHISNLRKKLPEGFVQTVRGVGYLVDKPLRK